MNALTGHCVSSCHSVMGTSFNCRADGKRTGGERNWEEEVEMKGDRETQTETEKVGGSYSKEKIKQRNKTVKTRNFFSSQFTMHLLCDQTLVMWREKLNKFLMMLGTSAALKICCT